MIQKIVRIFFLTLGVIFFVLIIIATYVYVADPLNIKPLLFGPTAEVVVPESSGDATSATVPTESDGGKVVVEQDKNPLLTDTQEQTLETFGIDPGNLPAEITPDQEACFVTVLGRERVDQIKAGDSPSVTEFFRL
jgi:hypothetical protein